MGERVVTVHARRCLSLLHDHEITVMLSFPNQSQPKKIVPCHLSLDHLCKPPIWHQSVQHSQDVTETENDLPSRRVVYSNNALNVAQLELELNIEILEAESLVMTLVNNLDFLWREYLMKASDELECGGMRATV